MTIKTPREIVYYPASRNEPDWLMCWIPFNELKKLVDKNRADKKILTDYPDGLDLEVTDEEFKFYLEKYNLKLENEPRNLSIAYEFLREKKMIKTPEYIRGKTLNRLSKQITDNETKELKKIQVFNARTVLKKKRFLSDKFSKKLDKMVVKPHRPRPSRRSSAYNNEVKKLLKVKLTKGDEPFEVMYKLYRRGRGD